MERIGTVTDYVDYRGKTPPKSDTGVFLVTAKNVKVGYIDYECSKEYVPYDVYEEVMRRGKPCLGDVLITTEAPLGNVASIDREDIALAQRIIKLRGKTNILSNEFLMQRLLSPQFQKSLFDKSTGSTAKGIKGAILHKLLLAFPTLPEQKKIASFLSTVDEKIGQLSQKKNLLLKYKKGVMQRIFDQKIRFKDDEGHDFPAWEEKKLEEVGENIIGLTYSPSDITDSITDGVVVLRSSNIRNDRLVLEDLVRVTSKIKSRLEIKENDILICTRNGSQKLIGKNVLIDKVDYPMTFGAFMSVFRSPHNVFIVHLLKTDAYLAQVQANLGARINQITTKTLNSFRFKFPCVEEQRKIAEFLGCLDSKIDFVEQRLKRTKALKKALLQQMFL